ncbi:HAD-IA family hydrolase [Catenovulum sp. 2E275]|uniref:HAD family hydrolase n=1 Tax=Catenovulum sp. 2E275 TaxID=2980497 RepID=UPI0021CF8EA4|nr:HAD-IA family hydrolase [Catenovulum sp. 2E275]MCU4674868.1 HAD-IA family hydrolase [Catenovulum sp. 2E275]
MKKFDVIVFDLGGVLLDISGVQDILNWRNNQESLPEFWLKWINSSSVRAFESGQMDADTFIQNIINEFELPVDFATFKNSYASWIKGIFNGIPELLIQLKVHYKLACLTNTNTLHWPEVEATGILNWIDQPFVSFEMGEVKPEAAIYQKMLAELNVPAERVLFIDDNQINVDAAKACGITAFRTVGFEQVKHCLIEQGVL